MNIRKLRVESLEERALLAVVAGGFEQAAELVAPTEATTWVVNTLEDPAEWDTADDVFSLREAIASAATGDTIVFDSELAEGTITLNGSQLEINNGITIDANGIGGITVDANEQSGVFAVLRAAEEEPVELISLTITGGNASSGGGIYVEESVLTLVDCSITGNKALSGAGICSDWESTLTMINCSVTKNSASGTFLPGGGIKSDFETTLIMIGCIVAENNARTGGGICTEAADVTLIDTLVVGNTADYGGGINVEHGILKITNCTVTGNSANFGAGIRGEVEVINSIVSLNSGSDDILGRFTSANSLIGLDPGFVVAPVFESGELTNFDELDLSLSSESCAIDRGDNNAVKTEIDLVGNPRIYAAWKETPTVDIGAYEYQAKIEKVTEYPSTIVTTAEDVVDKQDGLISLREAVTMYSNSGDTITFSPNLAGETILLSGTEIEITKAITIDASSIGGIVVDANKQSRVFNVQTGTGTPVELVGLTMTDGNTGVDPDDLRFEYGGGIFNSGNLTLTNCTVRDSYSPFGGGGIYSKGTLTLVNCNITGNSCGAYIRNGNGITICSGNGGGIHNFEGKLTITNSTISENEANEGYGGGICNWSYGTMILTNCLITGNSADYSGGGIDDVTYYISSLTNCTIVKNTVSGKYSPDFSGSGILIGSNTTCSICNSIVVNNDIDFTHQTDENGSPTNSVYAYNTLSEFTNWTDSSDCLVYDPARPLFVDPQNSDFTLAEQSQAANVGYNHYIVTETDIAGNPRIYGGIVDLGAYESLNITLETPTILTGTAGNYVSYGSNRHQIVWDENDNTFGYLLEYSEDGHSWTTIETTEPYAIITGLTYGKGVTYRVRALGTGLFLDSGWSTEKTFLVCPMDINGDGDISGADRVILSQSWLDDESSETYRYYADINGDGDVSGPDRNILSVNWLLNVEDDAESLLYPRPLAADMVFAEFESANISFDQDAF